MSFEEMLNELLANKIEIILIPAPEELHRTHYVRAVQTSNPDWYRAFVLNILRTAKNPKPVQNTIPPSNAPVPFGRLNR